MLVTVAICTWNRADSLRKTLESFSGLVVPRGVEWELLVVDNNSTDDTAQVLEEFRTRLPLRPLFEPRQGQSCARNRAIAEASGEILLWTDDDVYPDPHWIGTTLAAFQREAADIVFGRIEPRWSASVPKWFGPQFWGNFALLDYGPNPFVVNDDKHVFYGANHAVKVAAMRQLGGYSENLGLVGEAGGGEDTDLFLRARAAGLKIAYEPASLVWHVIEAARCRRGYHRRRTWLGCKSYYRELQTKADSPQLLGIPRYLFGFALADLKNCLGCLVQGDQSTAFYHELRLIQFAGVVCQALRTPRRVADVPQPAAKLLSAAEANSSGPLAAPSAAPVAKVSIIIATWNRAKQLDQALQEFRNLIVPPGVSWQLLVVNNGCTDNTDDVVKAHQSQLPLTLSHQPVRGKVRALNHALQLVDGQVVMFTDDDALVDPAWMQETLSAFEKYDATMVFGKVKPWWESRPPKWFSRRFDGHFALLDYGDEPTVIHDSQFLPYGVNYSFRRDAFQKIGTFNEELGPMAASGGGEDEDMFSRLLGHGMKVVYAPGAVVRHFIPESRCRKSFHRRRAWGGTKQYWQMIHESLANVPLMPRLLGLPRYLYRIALGDLWNYCRSLLTFNPGDAFYHQLRLIQFAGVLYHAVRSRRRDESGRPIMKPREATVA